MIHPKVQVQVEEACRPVRLSVPLLVAEAAAALVPRQRLRTETRSKLPQQSIHLLLCGRGHLRSLTGGTNGDTWCDHDQHQQGASTLMKARTHLLILMLMLHLLQRQPFTLFGCRPGPGESSQPGTARGRGFSFTFTCGPVRESRGVSFYYYCCFYYNKCYSLYSNYYCYFFW